MMKMASLDVELVKNMTRIFVGGTNHDDKRTKT